MRVWFIAALLLVITGCQTDATRQPAVDSPDHPSSHTAWGQIVDEGVTQLQASLAQAQQWHGLLADFSQQPSTLAQVELIYQGQQLRQQLLDSSPWLFASAPNNERRAFASHVLYWPGNLYFLDSTSRLPFGGLLGDLTVPLNADSLHYEHQIYSLSDLVLGITPMLLVLAGNENEPKTWQDFSDTPNHPRLAERRLEYLAQASQSLQTELQQQLQGWQTSTTLTWTTGQWQQWQSKWANEFARYWLSLDPVYPLPPLVQRNHALQQALADQGLAWQQWSEHLLSESRSAEPTTAQ